MTLTAGIDVGSTYAKCVLLGDGDELVARALSRTGFRLAEVSNKVLEAALDKVGLLRSDVDYVVSTGFGRHQVPFRDVQVTDLTAAARGCALLFPATRTILDIGGQTMKASLVDDRARVKSFRLNDKCAAGTGAFIEKTARYMGYETEEIGPLIATSKDPAPISGVCAVFAESEVINHLSLGRAPADIMHGAVASLVSRAVQLMKRVRMQPDYTLLGGILRFERMVDEIRTALDAEINIPPGDLVQYVGALGAARLGHTRFLRRNSDAATQPAESISP
jgi:predicted CoA-substrate-specific enzyme activase